MLPPVGAQGGGSDLSLLGAHRRLLLQFLRGLHGIDLVAYVGSSGEKKHPTRCRMCIVSIAHVRRQEINVYIITHTLTSHKHALTYVDFLAVCNAAWRGSGMRNVGISTVSSLSPLATLLGESSLRLSI